MLAYDDFAVTNDPTTGIPGRPSLRSELRRRKLFWITAAVVGLALGIGLYKKMPPPYKATALVRITPIPGTQAIDEILTEVQVAQSREVALMAMNQLHLPTDPKSVQGFMGSETVTAPTDMLVLYTVKASSADDAVDRAGALAQAFVQARNETLGKTLQQTISSLNETITRQQMTLVGLPARIAALRAKPKSAQQQAAIASLETQQKQLPGTLKALRGAVQSYIAATQVGNQQVKSGSARFGPPTAVPRSKIKYPALYVVGGLFAGVAIGMGWVILSALISTRPRRRYDVARALGAPVRLSIGRIRVNRLSARRAPESAGGRGVLQIATHLREAIQHEGGRASLAVVTVDDPVVPALSIISTAFSCIQEGGRVVLADLTPKADASRMLGCTGPGVYRQIAGQPNLTVAVPESSIAPPTGPRRRNSAAAGSPSIDPELDHAYHSADLLLTLVAIDPALGADHLSSWASDAVVVLTAGKSSATKIRTTAELIRLSGTDLVSAVVVGADKFDDSLGVLIFPEDDDLAEPSEDPDWREARETMVAQPNGSPERGPARPEPAERSQVRRESADRQHAGSERRAQVRPEVRSTAQSSDVKPVSKAETTMPDLRYEHLRTQPRRAVDLRKEDEKRQPDVPEPAETAAQPPNARPQNAPGLGTRPYSDAAEDSIGSQSSRSSAWRG
jgi:capsular polysaccharide biosynthesis protein